MNKGTNNEPKNTHRENASIERFKTFGKCSQILEQFFSMGFKSYIAFKAIVTFYYPDVDLVKLKRFWNCIGIDDVIWLQVEYVFDKLKKD